MLANIASNSHFTRFQKRVTNQLLLFQLAMRVNLHARERLLQNKKMAARYLAGPKLNRVYGCLVVVVVAVVVLGIYVPRKAKVIRRRYLGLKSYPKGWRSSGSNPGPLIYKASSFNTQ